MRRDGRLLDRSDEIAHTAYRAFLMETHYLPRNLPHWPHLAGRGAGTLKLGGAAGTGATSGGMGRPGMTLVRMHAGRAYACRVRKSGSAQQDLPYGPGAIASPPPCATVDRSMPCRQIGAQAVSAGADVWTWSAMCGSEPKANGTMVIPATPSFVAAVISRWEAASFTTMPAARSPTTAPRKCC